MQKKTSELYPFLLQESLPSYLPGYQGINFSERLRGSTHGHCKKAGQKGVVSLIFQVYFASGDSTGSCVESFCKSVLRWIAV